MAEEGEAIAQLIRKQQEQLEQQQAQMDQQQRYFNEQIQKLLQQRADEVANMEAQPGAQPVYTQQFTKYLDQERDVRQKNHDATIARREAEMMVKKVPKCDGSDAQLVREWVREVNLTENYSKETVWISAQTAEGALRRELEHFLSLQKDRKAVEWPTLRTHLEKAFLTPLEEDRLREQVEMISQEHFDRLAAYNMKFRELAELAYPPAPGETERNADQKRILLRNYIRGLKDPDIASKVISQGRPDTYEKAVEWASYYEADVYRLNSARNGREARVEEPMEIGAVGLDPKKSQKPQRQQTAPPKDDLSRRVDGLAKQVTRLSSALENSGVLTQGRSRRQVDDRRPADREDRRGRSSRYTDEGAPICDFCKAPGHIARQCRKKQTWQQTGRLDTRPDYGNQGGR